MQKLRAEVGKILAGDAKKGGIPPLWDGRAAERVAETIAGKTTAARAR
jgi:hypothetical protein